jgi:hypothetical protein
MAVVQLAGELQALVDPQADAPAQQLLAREPRPGMVTGVGVNGEPTVRRTSRRPGPAVCVHLAPTATSRCALDDAFPRLGAYKCLNRGGSNGN